MPEPAPRYFVTNLSGPRYTANDQSEARYFVNNLGSSRYGVKAQSEARYLTWDFSTHRFLLQRIRDDGSGFWSFAGEHWDDTHWHWDGSWLP